MKEKHLFSRELKVSVEICLIGNPIFCISAIIVAQILVFFRTFHKLFLEKAKISSVSRAVMQHLECKTNRMGIKPPSQHC
jgi:hypothetical protein